MESPFREFIYIPGPNPCLTPGPEGTWEDGVIESAHMLKDHDTYCWYYHGSGNGLGYQLGVATASHPLGPWTRHEANPVLALGPPGSWDDHHVACAFIVKEGTDRFTMWYSGMSEAEPDRWGIGLATSNSAVGPWEKHPSNPIIAEFGYVGGVVVREGKYYLYTEHPIGSTGQDYGPVSLAVADRPEGPYSEHDGPILERGEWGDWDDGGVSEAGVFLRSGIFHMFYGGTKLHPTRILGRESIGYAYSHDGINFTRHPQNPVGPREGHPNAAAFAEVHAYYEPPFVYCYHTLRYNDRDGHEDLGVSILATARPFALAMPLMQLDSLSAGVSTDVSECPAIPLGPVARCALTVQATCFGPSTLQAQAAGTVAVRMDQPCVLVPL